MIDTVSIIIPVYNGSQHMSAAIESALNQTYKDIEIIIVDDGSTDSSLQIACKYKEQDARVKVVTKPNDGPGSARNAGLMAASGQFIQFLDCDDTLQLNAVEILIETVKENQAADFVLFGFNVFSARKLLRSPNPGRGVYHPHDSYAKFKPIERLLASPCNKFYRRSFIKTLFPEHHTHVEDIVFNLSNLSGEMTIVMIENCLYNVQLSTNESRNKSYKRGKLKGILDSRRLHEETLSALFPDDFDVVLFRKNELSTAAYTICRLCCCLQKADALEEIASVMSEAPYLRTILKFKNLTKPYYAILLTALERRRYKLVWVLGRLLGKIRRLS